MASPLTKAIMNNISKKALNGNKCIEDNRLRLKNINQKEEEILKNILYKNNTKISLISLKNANKSNKSCESTDTHKVINESDNEKVMKSNEVKENPKYKIIKNMISLKDLAK